MTATAYFLALSDSLAGFNAYGAAFQVGKEAIFAIGVFNHDEIPGDVSRETIHPKCPDERGVVNSIAGFDDDAVSRCENRGVKARIISEFTAVSVKRMAIVM